MRQGERERLKAERWMRQGKEVRAGWVGGGEGEVVDAGARSR